MVCDARAMPGQSEDDVREHVDRALGREFRYELELLEPMEGGTESAIDTPLYRLCQEYVESRLPGAVLLPVITAGFSDSHWVRKAFGMTAYGFAPVFHTYLAEYLRGAHSSDESFHVDDLGENALLAATTSLSG